MDGWEKEVFFSEIFENPFGVSSIQIFYLLGEMSACGILGILWGKTRASWLSSLEKVEESGFC